MTRRSFGDVLDAALDTTAGPTSPVRHAGIGTAGLFAAPFGPWWRGACAFRSGDAEGLRPTPTAEPPAAEPLLRPRTDAEHHAWRRLQDFGAGLPAAFTASHLKRAFRRLARQLHPDGHPTLGADARADLCHDFARLRDAYTVLLGIGH
jgi:hypothetical protein